MRFFLSLIALSVISQTYALTASEAFVDAPAGIFPLLDRNTRLDMIDYFNSGSSTASTNSLNGKSRLTALSPEMLHIDMTDASDYSIIVLPDGNDYTIGLISTVATPTPDSNLKLYSSDWSNDVTSKSFQTPVLADWLTQEGKNHADEVEMMVPFMVASYSYDPATSTLTVTNNTEKFLTPDIYSNVSNYLNTSLKYKWNGKKFILQK